MLRTPAGEELMDAAIWDGAVVRFTKRLTGSADSQPADRVLGAVRN